MPVRRASASASHASANGGASSSRAHRPNESQHFGPPVSQTSLFAAPNATPQQKVVYVLVNRLKNKLPCNSGLSLTAIESDNAIQQAIESLVELSRDSLDIIAWALTQLLENLSKPSDASGHLSTDVLQSQLFVLKVLSVAMASRWRQREESRSSTRVGDYGVSGFNTPLESPSPTSGPAASRLRPSRERLHSPPPLAQSAELAPLDDLGAKYILSVMVLFLRQTAPPEGSEPDISLNFLAIDDIASERPRSSSLPDSPADVLPGDFIKFAKPAIRTQPSATSFGSGATRHMTPIPIPKDALTYVPTAEALSTSPLSLHTLIAKFAGTVVYHLSASNWPVVFMRMRARIHFLASTSQEKIEAIDLQLMTHCALDRTRLIQLLQEVSSLLLNMKRDAQLAVAIPLRAAIWRWIDLYPEEFLDALRAKDRRLEGAPERVFDLLYQIAEVANKQALWPTLTALMCICTDRLRVVSESGRRGPARKSQESTMVEQMSKHAVQTGSKLVTVSSNCLLDICKAASRIPADADVPLQSIAHDVAHDLKGALLKNANNRPFWETADEIDIGMFSDALVSIFRFMPEDDALFLYGACLEAERSDAVKLCAIAAYRTLAIDASQFRWQPPINKLRAVFSTRLRTIFKHAADKQPELENGIPKRPASRPRVKRASYDDLTDRDLLLVAILAVWRSDTALYFSSLDTRQLQGWVPKGAHLWDPLNEEAINLTVGRSFRFMVDAFAMMRPGDPSLEKASAWVPITTPQYIITVCTRLLDARVDLEMQYSWIHILHDLLVMYIRPAQYEHVKLIQTSNARIPAFQLAEITLLITLTSANSNVASTAAQCLRILAIADRQNGIPMLPGVSADERSKRHPIYEQLGDPTVLVISRVGQQKRIRKLVRLIASPSPSHIAVWEECYWRWSIFTEIAIRSPAGMSSAEYRESGHTAMLAKPLSQEDIQYQWRNLTLFLASFAAACTSQEPHDPSALGYQIQSDVLPDQMRVLQDPEDLVETFVSALIELLVADSVQARDVAKDALGSELSPRLYPRLFKHLDEVIHDVIQNAKAEWTEQFAIFLDQFIGVLKQLFDNLATSAQQEELISFDFGPTLLALAGFIARFNEPIANRAKVKFCNMMESASNRVEIAPPIRRDAFTYHDILDVIIEWIEDPVPLGSEDLIRGQKEVNMASLRAIVSTLEKNPPRPIDVSSGDDTAHVASRLFIRYSQLLVRMLDYNKLEQKSTDDSSSSRSSQSLRAIASQKDAELRELITSGLVHLVSGNTESGFKHGLLYAYDEDPTKRAMFAHVFARVLSKGTKFEAQDHTTNAARRSRLCELIRGPDMMLALAICEACPAGEVDIIIPVLFNLFDTRSSLMDLLKTMIDREVSHTENEAELFRGNSMCTRLLSAFGKLHGYQYLRNLVIPLIKTMASKPPGTGYELDPSKVSEEEVAQNKANVELVATSFLEIISASVPALPSMFREVCAHIARVVNEVWPEAKFAALGAFIFLRFISPVIVNPDIVDVEVPKDDGGVIRRGLMVIAKIIQNLANNIFFGKEAHMVVLNPFLRQNIANVTRFLSEVNKYSTQGIDDESDEFLGSTYDDTDTIVLHRFFEKHADKIGRELLSLSKPTAEGETQGKRAWDELCAALVELGQPLEPPRLSPMASSDHQEFLDLMDRYSHRNTDPVREIFVDVQTPNDQPAMFVLSVAKIDVEALDIDLLMVHILKTLTSAQHGGRMFEIILDFTSFTTLAEIPIQWLKYCMELVPSDVRQRLLTTYILNPNTPALKYLKRLWNISAGIASTSEFRACASVRELMEYVPPSVMASLAYAIKLEDEEYQDYKEVTYRQSPQTRMPVNLQIRLSHLRITSVKGQSIAPFLSCKTTDIIPLSDVSDVYNVSTGHDPFEFIVRRRYGVTMYFSSQSRENIVKTIREARGRMRGVQHPGAERSTRQSNIYATLLQIGMWSICHEEAELRSAAFELLSAVCTDLNFEENSVMSKAAFIPGNPRLFVMNLSERLAVFAPQLTLDFVTEVCSGTEKRDVASRIYSLQYMSPWIRNLAHFTNPASPHYEHSGARLRDCVRLLVDLTTSDQDLYLMLQKYVWSEVGKLDQVFVNVVLDELTRAAIDAGVRSRRLEIVAETVASLSSISVRGRIFSKIRKVLGKTTLQPTRNLADNVHWNEIACLTYLALLAGSNARQAAHIQLFMPEIVHLVTLVAGTGDTMIRKAVYAIITNMLQGLQLASTDDAVKAQLQILLDDCGRPETLRGFGLIQPTSMSGYMDYDPPNDKAYVDSQETLANVLARILEVTAGSTGLHNVWRARWMSLVTSTAFQQSPAIQSRAFVVLGVLATKEVDDDLLYQMLVAFKTALSQSNEADTTSVVSMLRCIYKVVPSLVEHSRYLPQLFWLAVALLQCSHVAFYIEATQLLRATLEIMEKHGAFRENGVGAVLCDARVPMYEVSAQLDSLLDISFDSSFSFSLVSTIFKGVRVSGLRDSAEAALRSLLRVTVRSADQEEQSPDAPICPEGIAYFLALLPMSTTQKAYRRLLEDARVDPSWMPPDTVGRTEGGGVPRVPFELLGVTDPNIALLVTSFVVSMLATAQGDDAESEILYKLLAETALVFPETVTLAYDGLQDRIKDTFANSVNPAILSAASRVFRVSVQDPTAMRGSASTLSIVDEAPGHGPGTGQLMALEELGMRGLASTFQFLPAGRGHATKMIKWIPELVSKIIE